MTTTEIRPESHDSSALPAPAARSGPSALERLFGSGDHKAVGRLYVGFALLFAVALAVAWAVGRFDVAADGDLLGSFGPQLASATQLGLAFHVLLPLFLGLALYIVPLQLGAATVAFPRAAAASFWSWLVSGTIFVVAVLADGGYGPDADPDLATLSNVALGALLVSLLLGSLCAVTTVVTQRRWGMTLDRVPLFSWSVLVAGGLWLVSLPAAFAAILVAHISHQGPVGLTEAYLAGIDWVVRQPGLYALAIPVLGIAGDVVPVFARRRASGHLTLLATTSAFGALSFGAWVQSPLGSAGGGLRDNLVVTGFALLVGLALLGFVGSIAATLKAGRVRVAAPLVLAVVALLLLLGGVAIGAASTIDWFALDGGQAAVSQFGFVVAAALAGATAGIWYWSPKLFGAEVGDKPGLGVALLLLGGGALLGLPDAIGSIMARDGGENDAAELFAALGGIGAVLVGLALLATLGGVFGAARRGASGGPADPWGGHTFEWAAPSPPPEGNFVDDLPPVLSECPLLDLTDQEAGA